MSSRFNSLFQTVSAGLRFSSQRKTVPDSSKPPGGKSADAFGVANVNEPSSSSASTTCTAVALRKAQNIHVQGSAVPKPVSSFLSTDLVAWLRSSLASEGFSLPTPVQAQTIPLLLQSRDVFSRAPTGSGKTLAFVIPILSKLRSPAPSPCRPRACIVVPTRELAVQVRREIGHLCGAFATFTPSVPTPTAAAPRKSFGEATATSLRPHVPFTFVSLGSKEVARAIAARDSALSNGVDSEAALLMMMTSIGGDIAVCTPGQLASLVEAVPDFLANLEYFVLDEADVLLQDEFIEAVDTVISKVPDHTTKAIFTATLTVSAESAARTLSPDAVRVMIGDRTDTTGTNIEHRFSFVGSSEASKVLMLLQDLIDASFPLPAIVFTQSQRRAEDLYSALQLASNNPAVGDLKGAVREIGLLHGQLSSKERDGIITAFRSGFVGVLVATDIASRGLDFRDVRTVVNFDFPTNPVLYVHRTGRTGRAGRKGVAVTFWTESDRHFLQPIAAAVRKGGGDVPEWMLKLPKPTTSQKRVAATLPPARDVVSAEVNFARQERAAKEAAKEDARRRRYNIKSATRRLEQKEEKKQQQALEMPKSGKKDSTKSRRDHQGKADDSAGVVTRLSKRPHVRTTHASTNVASGNGAAKIARK